MLGQPGNKELFVAVVGAMSMFCTAVTYSWSSPLINSFRQADSILYLTSFEVAFLTTICDICGVVISVPAAYLADIWGRKPLVWMSMPISGLSWIALLAYTNKATLFTVRAVQGLMVGIQNAIMSNYMAEVATVNMRGNIVSCGNIGWHFGTFCTYIFGAFFELEGLTWFTLIPQLIFTALFFWYPESPYYLVMTRNRDKALNELVWLRGGASNDTHIVEEMEMIDETIKHEKSINKGAWKNIFFTKKGRKSLFIVELITIVYAMGGTNTIPVYVSDTMAQLNGDVDLANVITIILGALLVVFVIPTTFLADKWGRRPVLLMSMAGSVVFLVPTIISLYLIQIENVSSSFIKTSFYVSVILTMSFSAFGVETLQCVVASEFFPSTSRSIFSGGTNAFTTLLQSLSCYLYEFIDDQVGMYLNYVIFLIINVAGFTGISILMPETRCKTFAEIQSSL